MHICILHFSLLTACELNGGALKIRALIPKDRKKCSLSICLKFKKRFLASPLQLHLKTEGTHSVGRVLHIRHMGRSREQVEIWEQHKPISYLSLLSSKLTRYFAIDFQLYGNFLHPESSPDHHVMKFFAYWSTANLNQPEFFEGQPIVQNKDLAPMRSHCHRSDIFLTFVVHSNFMGKSKPNSCSFYSFSLV